MDSFDKLEEWRNQGGKKEGRNWEVGSVNRLVEIENEVQEPYCELTWILRKKPVCDSKLISVTGYGKTPELAVEEALKEFEGVYSEA